MLFISYNGACRGAAATADYVLNAVVQVPGSTLGAELAALLDNSEGSDISFKVRICRMVSTWAPQVADVNPDMLWQLCRPARVRRT